MERTTFYVWTLMITSQSLICALAPSFHGDTRHHFDLIESLQIHNRTYKGLVAVDGVHRLSPAILLEGDSRSLQLSADMVQKISKSLMETNEFSFIATVKQEERNVGTIISFADGNDRFLELQSSGRKFEIRFHYTHKEFAFVETFPYHLTDSNWHQIAVSISGNVLNLYVDCSRIYRRLIHEINYNFTSRNISLWLGQRNAKHFLYKGYLQDVKIITEPHGYMIQCSNLETDCPTCGQFQQLKKSMVMLENHIKILTERLAFAENHISSLQKCECQKSCSVNGSTHPDGSTWMYECNKCSCLHGDIMCAPVECPAPQCKNPVSVPGECCPICLKKCLFEHVLYDHGEKVNPVPCATCECINASMHCQRFDPETSCPVLPCPPEERFSDPDQCCRFCKGVDYCGQGHDCHSNASCMNLNTHYKCQCNKGYEGSGKHCEDVNECLHKGGHDGHHCRENTKCVNIPGDYFCECLPGYRRADKFNCLEINECNTEENACHFNALCTNTPGSYKCECLEGYSGDGYNCKPICSSPCLNGGQCVGPDTCLCLQGYMGETCELDIDECSLNMHMCHPNSVCVNMPGWYYCQCLTGYQSHPDDKLQNLCQDINECMVGSHTCSLSALCVNDDGGYHCECLENSSCVLSCLYYGEERLNGELWSSDTCTNCQCLNGVVSCSPVECDCSKSNVNMECCPHCDHTSVCKHQTSMKSFHNGDQWIYKCQTCECLHGEIDCWNLECPPINCENPFHIPGDCCARCDTDSCSFTYNATHSEQKSCAYNGLVYKPGDEVPLVQDPCSSCHCQDGFLCCKYSRSCFNNFHASEPQNEIASTDDSVLNDLPNDDDDLQSEIVDENRISHHSTSNSNSVLSYKAGRRLLSVLFNFMDSKESKFAQIGKYKEEDSVKRKYVPYFGNMKLSSEFKGAFVEGASIKR